MTNNELDFEQVYASFQPAIYRYLTRLIGTKDSEDLTQDVFIKVNKALGTFKNQSQLSTWIYQIATNTAIDKMRSRSFKQESTEAYSLIEADLNEKRVASDKKARSIEEQLIRKEMNECIQGIIASLPEEFRIVITLSEMEDLKNNEIAAILGLSLSAVKIRLHRAKARLKKELLVSCNFYQAECGVACEAKEPVLRKINSSMSKKVLTD